MSKLVVIGNGPSLKGFEFDKLNHVDTLGMNAAYRYWDQINWYPTYYVCMDDKVTQTHHKNIKRLIDSGRIKKFFLTRFMLDFYPELKFDSRIYFLEQFNEKYSSLAKKYELNTIESKFFKSSAPAKITTGSNAVRFGCFLGYKEIAIIGVDLEYKEIKDGITNESGIELKVTKKIDNNPNYFFDGYQDVGDSFNVPNPSHLGDLHFDVFTILAKDRLFYFWPVTIYNANEKSKLFQEKVFPHITIDNFIYSNSSKKENCSSKIQKNISDLKILVIDPTYIGHQSATGQIKSLFFSNITKTNIAQICVKFDDSSISGAIGYDSIKNNRFNEFQTIKEVTEFVREFSPDIIYCRPIGSTKLFDAVFAIKKTFNIPLITHFMDDWVLRYQQEKKSEFKSWEYKILELVRLSDIKVAISKKMAESYTFRYGGTWHVLANGINHQNFHAPSKLSRDDKKFVIRYMGGAADDMNYQSLVDIAYAIESDKELKSKIAFEIYTMPWYLDKLQKNIGNFSSCTIQKLVAEDKYHDLINTSDALLIAYNFDSNTEKYVSLSMANKMPECLASGVPVIAFGPSDIATINFLESYGLASIINKRTSSLIKSKLNDILRGDPAIGTMAARAHNFSINFLNANDVTENINNLLLSAINEKHDADEFHGYTSDIINLEQYIINEEINLSFANECFNNGLYLKALMIYFKLLQNMDFMKSSLELNIHLCLRRLSFKNLDPSIIKSRFF
jgi:hypothetical protein